MSLEVKDGYLGDLTNDLQNRIMQCHKLFKTTIKELLESDDKYKVLINDEWAKSKIDEFLTMPTDKTKVGSVRLYKNKEKYSCMIQASGHFEHLNENVIENTLSKLINALYEKTRKEIKEKYKLTLSSEYKNGETFEGFDLWVLGEEAKNLWDIFEFKPVQKIKKEEELYEYVIYNDKNVLYKELPTQLKKYINESVGNIINNLNILYKKAYNTYLEDYDLSCIKNLINSLKNEQLECIGESTFIENNTCIDGSINISPKFKIENRAIRSIINGLLKFYKENYDDGISELIYSENDNCLKLKLDNNYSKLLYDLMEKNTYCSESVFKYVDDKYITENAEETFEEKFFFNDTEQKELKKIQSELNETIEKNLKDILKDNFDNYYDFSTVHTIKDFFKYLLYHLLSYGIMLGGSYIFGPLGPLTVLFGMLWWLISLLPFHIKFYTKRKFQIIGDLYYYQGLYEKNIDFDDICNILNDKYKDILGDKYKIYADYDYKDYVYMDEDKCKENDPIVRLPDGDFTYETARYVRSCVFYVDTKQNSSFGKDIKQLKNAINRNKNIKKKIKEIADKKKAKREVKKELKSESVLHSLCDRLINNPTQSNLNTISKIFTEEFLPRLNNKFNKFEIQLLDYPTSIFEVSVSNIDDKFINNLLESKDSISHLLHNNENKLIYRISPIAFKNGSANDIIDFLKESIMFYADDINIPINNLIYEYKLLPNKEKYIIEHTDLNGILPMLIESLFIDNNFSFKESSLLDNENILADYLHAILESKDSIDNCKMIVESIKSLNNYDILKQIKNVPMLLEKYHNKELVDIEKQYQIQFENDQVDKEWHLEKDKTLDYYQEGFFSRVKKLKKFPSDLIAYITIETEGIKDLNDKLILASYTLGKIDIVEWYIELLETNSKNYIVPYTKDQLQKIRTQLLNCYKKIMAVKIVNNKQINLDVVYIYNI